MPSININESTGRIQYTATSGQTEFIYDFVIFAETDIVVVKAGVTLEYLTDYTVSGVENNNGGTVTLLVGATVGDLVTLYRDTGISRISKYNPDGRFDAAPLERDFDIITTIMQELKRDGNRTIKLSPDDSLDELVLPTDRENKFLSFDSNGSPIAVVGSTSSGSPFGATGIDLAAANTPAIAVGVLGLLTSSQSVTSTWNFNGTINVNAKFVTPDKSELTISSGAVQPNGELSTRGLQSTRRWVQTG